MAIFNSYVKLPEGIHQKITSSSTFHPFLDVVSIPCPSSVGRHDASPIWVIYVGNIYGEWHHLWNQIYDDPPQKYFFHRMAYLVIYMRMAIIYQNHHRNGAGVGIAEHPVFYVSLNVSEARNHRNSQHTIWLFNIAMGHL